VLGVLGLQRNSDSSPLFDDAGSAATVGQFLLEHQGEEGAEDVASMDRGRARASASVMTAASPTIFQTRWPLCWLWMKYRFVPKGVMRTPYPFSSVSRTLRTVLRGRTASTRCWVHDIAVDRVRIERAVEPAAAAIVGDRAEERSGGVPTVARPVEIVPEPLLGLGMQRRDAHPAPVAGDLQAGPALHADEIAHAEAA